MKLPNPNYHFISIHQSSHPEYEGNENAAAPMSDKFM